MDKNYITLSSLVAEIQQRQGATINLIFEELRNNSMIDWNAIKENEKKDKKNWYFIEKQWKWYVIRRFVSKGLFPNGGDRISKLTGAQADVARQIETFVSNVDDDIAELVIVDAAVHSIGGKFDIQNPTVEKQATFTEFIRSLTREYVRQRRHITNSDDEGDAIDASVNGFEIIERHTTTITETTNSVDLLANLTSNDCRMVLVEKERTIQEQQRTTQEQKKIEYLKEITTTFKCIVGRVFLQ